MAKIDINICISSVSFLHLDLVISVLEKSHRSYLNSTMGILKGKEQALSHIDQSKTAFLATLSEVEQGASTHTMPPTDHYTLKFKRETIKNLKGRVYETMKQYAYEQIGFDRLSKIVISYLF